LCLTARQAARLRVRAGDRARIGGGESAVEAQRDGEKRVTARVGPACSRRGRIPAAERAQAVKVTLRQLLRRAQVMLCL